MKRLISSVTRARNALRVESPEGFLGGRLGCIALRDVKTIGSLADVEFRVTSQWGEDGIIEWLVQRLGVPAHSFVEFGVDDYRESNTRFLMQNRNWRGLVIDGSAENMEFVRRDQIYWRHNLRAKAAFITRENINDLIRAAGLSGEIGLLSVDIDGNDYWVWERIDVVNPIICIVEYNAVLGDRHALSIPYDPAFVRSSAHSSNLYFGASIRAFESLGRRKGYTLIGSNTAGSNAFFVRDDYMARLSNAIADTAARPSQFRESRDESGKLTFVSGLDRLKAIAALDVIDVETGKAVKVESIQGLYSDVWARELGGGAA